MIPSLAGRDGIWRWNMPDAQSPLAQVAVAVSLLTTPVVIVVLLGVAVWWSMNRRLKSMAAAIVLAVVLTWSTNQVFEHLIQRGAPYDDWRYLIGTPAYSYPSSHVAAATMAVVLMVALTTMTRRSVATIWAWRIVGTLGVIVVALDRLILGLASISDVIGGVLQGAATTLIAMLICDVHAHAAQPSFTQLPDVGRAAIIYNPTKVPDKNTFMRLVDACVADLGWEPPLWLSTTPEDPGHEMARTAIESKFDVVLVAGGDGTVRVVCGEFAGSDIPLLIVPAGTGNLLARNVGIPLDYDRALRLLAEGRAAPMDVVKYTSNDENFGTQYSVVMSGMGIDAAIMEDTDEDLKKQIGSLAYFAAGLQHLKVNPLQATMRLDDGEPQRVRASFIGVGNVGAIQGGLTVIPEASASDGIMDIMLADPKQPSDVAKMAGALLTNAESIPHITRHTAAHLDLELDEPSLFQIDGDLVGTVHHLKAEVMHHAIQVIVPS